MQRARAATTLEMKADMFFIPQTNLRIQIDQAKRIEVFEDPYAAMLRNEYESAAKKRFIEDTTWNFLMAIKRIRAHNFPQSSINELNDIVENYVKENSPHQINISDNQRNAIINALSSGNAATIKNAFDSTITTVVTVNFFGNFAGDMSETLEEAEKVTILGKDILASLEKLNNGYKENKLKFILGNDAKDMGLDEEKISDDEIKKVFETDLNLIHKEIDPLLSRVKLVLEDKSIQDAFRLKSELRALFNDAKLPIENSKNYIAGLIEHENSSYTNDHKPIDHTLSQYLSYIVSRLENDINNLSLNSFAHLYQITESQLMATRNRTNTMLKPQEHARNESSGGPHYQFVPMKNELDILKQHIEPIPEITKKDKLSGWRGFFSHKGKNKKKSTAHTRNVSKDDIGIQINVNKKGKAKKK